MEEGSDSGKRCQLFRETATARPVSSHLATCPYLSYRLRFEKICAAPHMERITTLSRGREVSFFFSFFLFCFLSFFLCAQRGASYGVAARDRARRFVRQYRFG